MSIQCIIVDDEPLAQKGLKEYIADIDFLKLVAVCDNAMQAADILRAEKVDLILLDIEMPVISGIDFIKSLNYKPAVIFTTAYPEYALQGYDLDVTDYLVKPILFQRFLKAVNKARHYLEAEVRNPSQQHDYFFLKVNYQLEKILFKDVLFIEARQNYVAVHLNGKKIINYITISGIEKQLPANRFMRIHKSYIIALDKIERITGNKVLINTYELPVSRNSREQLIHAVSHKLVKR